MLTLFGNITLQKNSVHLSVTNLKGIKSY